MRSRSLSLLTSLSCLGYITARGSARRRSTNELLWTNTCIDEEVHRRIIFGRTSAIRRNARRNKCAGEELPDELMRDEDMHGRINAETNNCVDEELRLRIISGRTSARRRNARTKNCGRISARRRRIFVRTRDARVRGHLWAILEFDLVGANSK